jgi:hypothetical protein
MTRKQLASEGPGDAAAFDSAVATPEEVAELRSEVASLKERLRPLEQVEDERKGMSRRSALGKLGAAAAAGAGLVVLGAQPAEATHVDGDVTLGADEFYNDAGGEQTGMMSSNSESTLFVHNTGQGDGLEARGDTGAGVHAYSRTSNGVYATGAFGYNGVYARNRSTGNGVFGEVTSTASTATGNAILGIHRGPGNSVFGYKDPGTPGDAVVGFADSGAGVFGISRSGRGGIFQGDKAPVRLQPSSASTHPALGVAGDLFVDSSKSLWFCKGGNVWTKLA